MVCCGIFWSGQFNTRSAQSDVTTVTTMSVIMNVTLGNSQGFEMYISDRQRYPIKAAESFFFSTLDMISLKPHTSVYHACSNLILFYTNRLETYA